MWNIVITIIFLQILIYLWATWHYNYWKNLGLPYIKPIPLFGNIKDLVFMKRNAGEVYSDFYRKYPDASAVGMYNMRSPQLLLRSIDLIKAVLVTEFNSFHDNIYSEGAESDLFARASVFVSKGERWKTLRSLHSQSLSSNKIKGMFPLMERVCKDMKDYIGKNLDRPIEAKYFSGQYTTDFVASCVYGLKTNSFLDPDAEFRKMASSFFRKGVLINIIVMMFQFLPSISKLFSIRLISQDVTNFFIKVVKDLYEFRKENNVRGNDFLQYFLDDYMKNDQPVYSLEEITAHTMTFFLDGYDTTSTVMAFTLYMLALHPDIQQRVREEIHEMPKCDFESLNNLKYLDAVINETLRLYPPGLLLTRECTKDVTLKADDHDYPLTKGMQVVIPVYPLLRDAKYFSEPEEFDPSKFYECPVPAAFFPFSLGPRACLGSKFALTQIKLALVHVIQNFQVTPKDLNSKLPALDPQNAIVIVPKSGLWIKFENL